MHIRWSAQSRLLFVVILTAAFCIAEIVIGFRTHSLALIADSFHYLFDFGSYLIAYVANRLIENDNAPDQLPFGWARARVLGSFVNGIALVALGFSIFIQSLQRFIIIEKVTQPLLVLITGCVGLLLNGISLAFFHGAGEPTDVAKQLGRASSADVVCVSQEIVTPAAGSPNESKPQQSHDHGFRALFLHAVADTAANLGVITAACIIWKSASPARFYADPTLSLAISFLIIAISIPLIRRNGLLLIESAPDSVQREDLVVELSTIDGVADVHDLRIWRLNEQETLATAHIVLEEQAESLATVQRAIRCFTSHGVARVTIQTCDRRL